MLPSEGKIPDAPSLSTEIESPSIQPTHILGVSRCYACVSLLSFIFMLLFAFHERVGTIRAYIIHSEGETYTIHSDGENINDSLELPLPFRPLDSSWRFYTDTKTLPFLFPGAQSRTTAINHERNYDFSTMLYAENDRTYMLDVAGPVCLAHYYFVSAGSPETAYKLESAEFHVEVDGAESINLGSVVSLFKGDYAADLQNPGNGEAFWQPRKNLSSSDGWGSGIAALPRPITYAVERGGSLRSGFVLYAPICAHESLRMSIYFPPPNPPAPVLVQDGSDCVAFNTICQLPLYIDSNIVTFSGTLLPPGLQPFTKSPAFVLPGDEEAIPDLAGDVRRIWSPYRLYSDALEEADEKRSTYRCGVLGPEVREFEVFLDKGGSSKEGPGGLGTLLSFDFPKATHLLHSARVRLEARWDDGRGNFDLDLESLFGPSISTHENFLMGDIPRDPTNPFARVYPSSSSSKNNNVSAVASGGLYLAMPMPWYSSARVVLVYTGEGGEISSPLPPTLLSYPTVWPPYPHSRSSSTPPTPNSSTFEVCASFLVSRHSVHSVGASILSGGKPTIKIGSHGPGGSGDSGGRPLGYLQSAIIDGSSNKEGWSMSPNDGTLIRLTGFAGSLVMFAMYAHISNPLCVEGDIRLWADGSATPIVWSSGMEDFFDCGHGYAYMRHHTEAFTAWDRDDLHIYQRRFFTLDAPRFSHSLLSAWEGVLISPNKPSLFRATSLFYGVQAPPPVVTDILRPLGVLKGGSSGGISHYSLFILPHAENRTAVDAEVKATKTARLSQPPDITGAVLYVAGSGHPLVEEYELESLVPSMGDLKETELMGGGAGGGVPIVESVLAVKTQAVVKMTLKVIPGARSVVLRRLVDVRRSVSLGNVWVNGNLVKRLRNTDRSFDTLDAYWQWESFELPHWATADRHELHVEILVDVETDVADRYYVHHQLSPAWTETLWEVHCFPKLE